MFRSVTYAAATAILAVAAHGVSSGEYPSSAAAVLLLVWTLAVGAVAARRGSGWSTLLVLLGGQVGAHLLLHLSCGADMGSAILSPSMVAAHVVAAAGCVALVDAATRLALVCSSTLRAAVALITGAIGPNILVRPAEHAGVATHTLLVILASLRGRAPPRVAFT